MGLLFGILIGWFLRGLVDHAYAQRETKPETKPESMHPNPALVKAIQDVAAQLKAEGKL